MWPKFTTVAGFILCNYIELITFKKEIFVGKRIHPYISGILQIFLTLMFSSFFWQMPVYLVGDAKPVLYSEHSITDLPSPMVLTSISLSRSY